jgi:hypothetical protein
MTPFDFEPASTPFNSWLGPYSPARGTRAGFRFSNRQLGTWVEGSEYLDFWVFAASKGSTALATLVLRRWSGGRVLLLPNGLVIKPLQGDHEVGKRVVVGHFTGSVVVKKPTGEWFDFSNPGALEPGDDWNGPKTTGLECTLQVGGSIFCTWYTPSNDGEELHHVQLFGPDPLLASGFRAARRGETVGRVRLTANGHVITNVADQEGYWKAKYVGRIDPSRWHNEPEWFSTEAK